MADNYINNYKRRFYNHKIRGIYATGIALNFAIFLVVFFTLSMGDWELTNLGYFMMFGLMASILLASIFYANHVRIKRIRDDIVGKRIPDLNGGFWVSCINKSTVALVLWEVFLFILLYELFKSNAPGVVVFVMLVLMIGVLIVKLRYNRMVKDLRQRHLSFGLGEKEYPISWSREMFMELFSALFLELLIILCLLIEGANSEQLSRATVVLFVIFTIALIITLVVRLLTKVKLREEDELRKWKELQKWKEMRNQDEKKTETEPIKQEKQEKQVVGQTVDFEAEEVKHEYCASFLDLSKSFYNYAAQCGLRIDEGDCRNIISAMATSRAIWLRSENQEFTAIVAKMLSRYFTGKVCELHLRAGSNTVQDMVQSPVQTDEAKTTNLAECLYKAKRATNSVNVLTIHNAEIENFETVFKQFIRAFRAPEGENRLSIDYTGNYARYVDEQNSKIMLPTNLWYIFVGNAGNRLDNLKCEYATEVKLRYTGEAQENIIETKKLTFLSFARYNELLNESLTAHFLPLEVWKKFDRIEEYLQEKIPFAITNPLARQMEQYSSVQLSCEEEQDVVIDTIIESRLLPLLEGYTKEDVNQEGNTFAELLDGLFGMDNLPLTHKALLDKNLS